MTKQEWKEIKGNVYYDFLQDNHFSELKNAEIMRDRISLLRDMDEFVGKYFSQQWIRKNVLYQTDDDIEEMNKQNDEMEKEQDDMGDGETETDKTPASNANNNIES